MEKLKKLQILNKIVEVSGRKTPTPHLVDVRVDEMFKSNILGILTHQYEEGAIPGVGKIFSRRTEATVNITFVPEGSQETEEYSFTAGDKAVIELGVDLGGRTVHLRVNETKTEKELSRDRCLWKKYLASLKND